MTEIKIPQMRSIKQAAAECSIPEHFLRQLVKQNKVVYVRAGAKALVNLESLAAYLSSGEQEA
ncbi:MAG: DNA-binding protein [Oscillospiraceae bacterium]